MKLTNELKLSEVMRLWKKYDGTSGVRGSSHVYTIKGEQNFYDFMEEVLLLQSNRQEWDSVADEMGENYAFELLGKRP